MKHEHETSACKYCGKTKKSGYDVCQLCFEKSEYCNCKCDPSGKENWHKGKCLDCNNNPILINKRQKSGELV